MEKRSPQGIVYSEIPVNSWAKAPPSIEATRPPRCARCGEAARPAGEKLMVVGHGVRLRQLRVAKDEGARTLTLHARRFRCRACSAILVVVPRAVSAGRHFERRAIAAALYLFGVAGWAMHAVRTRLGGLGAGSRWRTLARWCDAASDGRLFGRIGNGAEPRRRVAAGAAMRLLALAPAAEGMSDLERAMLGAGLAK